jgi:hypothetical protein
MSIPFLGANDALLYKDNFNTTQLLYTGYIRQESFKLGLDRVANGTSITNRDECFRFAYHFSQTTPMSSLVVRCFCDIFRVKKHTTVMTVLEWLTETSKTPPNRGIVFITLAISYFTSANCFHENASTGVHLV